MADKDPSQLTAMSGTPAGDTIVDMYPAGGPMRKATWDQVVAWLTTAVGGAYLIASQNLADLVSASAARANLGLGTAAQLASSALFQVANNLSEVANAATARANLGAAASAGTVLTAGLTMTGSTKQNTFAPPAAAIDLGLSDFFQKSISANTTFTFINPTAGQVQAFVLELTISSAAVPTWPASVRWGNGQGTTAPALGNGRHVLGFLSFDGGTSWTGFVGAKNA